MKLNFTEYKNFCKENKIKEDRLESLAKFKRMKLIEREERLIIKHVNNLNKLREETSFDLVMGW